MSRKTSKKIRPNGENIFAIVFLLMFIGVICASYRSMGVKPYNGSSLVDFSEGWTAEDGSQTELSDIHEVATASGGKAEITNYIPQDVTTATELNFRSKAVFFEVYIGNEEVYRYYPMIGHLCGRSYGSTFHHIHIPAGSDGESIKIIAEPIYDDDSCFFNMMKLGDSGDFYQWFMGNHFLSFLLSIIIFFFGIIILLFAILVRNDDRVVINLISLGFLAMLSGVWSALQTLVPQMIFGNQELCQGLNYLALIMLPYPAVCFFNSMLNKPKKIYETISLYITLGGLLVCEVLNIARINDFHEMLPVIHSSELTALVIIIVAIIFDMKNKDESSDTDKVTFIAFGFFVICALIDMLRYVLSDNGVDDNGFFIRIGFFICIFAMAYRSIRNLINFMKLAAQTETIKKIAYSDALTGVPNRAAFVHEESILQKLNDDDDRKEMIICQMDLNNLKKANDLYGHRCGDELIMRAANVINVSFGDIGTCYRVGGDEFTVFVIKEPVRENCEKALQHMQDMEKEYNSRKEVKVPLNIAYGYALAVVGSGTLIEHAERKADDNMYEMKRRMKENSLVAGGSVK